MRTSRIHPLDISCCASLLAYSAGAVITPVCLIRLAGDLSLNLTEGGGIEAVRGLALLCILIVSGFAASRWGKARSMGVGTFLLAAGLFLYAGARSYPHILGAMAFVGIGGGIVEALANPLVHDQHPRDSGRYLNIVNGFWSIGVFGTVLLAGELLTRGIDWRSIAAGIAAASLPAALLFFVFAKQEHTHRVVSAGQTLRHLVGILRERRFWPFAAAMFFGAGAEGSFTFWSASHIQISFAGTPRAGGIGTACFAAGMLAGRFASGHFVPQHRLKHLIMASAGLGIAVSLVLPTVRLLGALYVVLVIAGLAAACFWPSIQSFAADRLRVDHTMLFILLSCTGIPGFGLTSWAMGYIADKAGVRAAFLLVPVLFAFLALIVATIPAGPAAVEHSDT